MKAKLACILLAAACISQLQGQANRVMNYGDLPTDLIPPAGWIQDTWTDPGGWAVIDVTKNGLPANSPNIDATPIVDGLIRANKDYKIIYFPEGEYYFKSVLTISQDGVRIKGDGIDKTKLYQQNCEFRFRGKQTNTVIALSTPPKRGDTVINTVDANRLSVGSYIMPLAKFPWGGQNDKFKNEMENVGRGQIVQVKSINGNAVTISEPLGLDFRPWPDPRIDILGMTKDVGMESVHIEKLFQDSKDTIEFDRVTNAYLKGVRCFWTHAKTIEVRRSYRVFIEDSNISQGWDKTNGGMSYGIHFSVNTTRCYAINNKLEQLRHGIILQQGANHCVVAYNNTKSNILLHGNYAHNNLIEGNVADAGINFDNVHGPNGPFNFIYRNVSSHGSKGIGTLNGTAPYPVIGNVADNFNDIRPEDYYGANRIAGVVVWGTDGITQASTLPTSLLYPRKPWFLRGRSWPLFGPGAGNDWGENHSTPSSVREITSVPSAEMWQDTDGDGIPDSWESTYFPNLAGGWSDSDHDGQDDYAEFLAGTNPANSKDSFKIQSLTFDKTSGNFALSFDSNPDVAERRYRILYSTTLAPGSWQVLPTGSFTPNLGLTTEKTFSTPLTNSASTFFRVEALMAAP